MRSGINPGAPGTRRLDIHRSARRARSRWLLVFSPSAAGTCNTRRVTATASSGSRGGYESHDDLGDGRGSFHDPRAPPALLEWGRPWDFVLRSTLASPA